MRRIRMMKSAGWVLSALLLMAAPAAAQVTAAAGYTPPDDTPTIRVGVTFFGDYTYQQNPTAADADGNQIHPNSFNDSRAYINITGNISHLVAFRFTPDITRAGSDSGTVLNGNLVFRVKYGYAQFNLDEWTRPGTWVRFGIQQTPWVDFEEGVYRYRFQGTVFSEREGYQSSSDAGVSFHYNLPHNYGEFHTGVYNGENYNRAEANDQKAIQFRGSIRPFATAAPILRGLRVHYFIDKDDYLRSAVRNRMIGSVTYEQRHLNAGFDYMATNDQTSAKPGTVELKGKGYSVWATPRQGASGFEALLRYDHMQPNTSVTAERNRTIIGGAYWFPHEGNVSAAVLVDYDGQTFSNFATAQPAQKKIAVHALLNF